MVTSQVVASLDGIVLTLARPRPTKHRRALDYVELHYDFVAGIDDGPLSMVDSVELAARTAGGAQ